MTGVQQEDPCLVPGCPVGERIARTEEAVSGLTKRVHEIVEWKHHILPPVLAEIQNDHRDLKEEFDRHLILSAEKIANYDSAVKKAEELEALVSGKDGLLLSVSKLEGGLLRNEHATRNLEATVGTLAGDVKGLAGVIVTKNAKKEATKNIVLALGWILALLASIVQVSDWLVK